MPNSLVIAAFYLIIHNPGGLFTNANDIVIPYNSMKECMAARQYFLDENNTHIIPGSVDHLYKCIPGSTSANK